MASGDRRPCRLRSSGLFRIVAVASLGVALLTVTAYSDPEISVQGNLIPIADGDTSPEITDNTSFGEVQQGDSLNHDFTITNSGTSDLNLTSTPRVSVTGTAFTLITDALTPIQSAGSTVFTIQFTAQAAGYVAANEGQISIANDDLGVGKNPYTFSIHGSGGYPEMGMLGNGTPIPDGDTTPSTGDGTDFGTVRPDGATASQTFFLANGGKWELELTGTPLVDITGAHASDFTVTAQPAVSVIPRADYSQTYTIEFDPSGEGLRTATVTIDNDDPNENPYDFAIQGTGDGTAPTAPTVLGIDDDNGSAGSDGKTNDDTLQIFGTAEADSTVEVFRDSASLGTTSVDGSGNWNFDDTGTTLSDGTYGFTAKATDAAGNTSLESAPLSVVVDTQLPPAPGDAGRTPTRNTYTNGDRPVFDWAEVTDLPDPGGSGVRDYHIQVIDSSPSVAKDSYPADTDYQPGAGFGLADDTYTWKLATRDVAGNTGSWGTTWTLTVDTDAPGLTSFTLKTPPTSPTNADTLVFLATFDEDVQNVNAADFAVNGTSGAAVASVNPVSASSYDITVSGGTLAGHNGVVGIDLAASPTISDLAGNALPAGEPTPDATYTVDNTAPTISIGSPSAADTRSGPVTYTVTYGGADAVTLAIGDVTLNKTGTADGFVGVGGSGTGSRTVTISSITGDGSLGISIAAGTASDTAGNSAPTAGPSAAFNVDNTAPTVAITDDEAGTANIAGGSVTYTFTFSEGVTGFTTTEVSVANGTKSGLFATGLDGDAVYTLVVTPSANFEGNMTVDVAAAAASDTAGNGNTAAMQSVQAVDTKAPWVTGVAVDTNPVYEGDLTQQVEVTFNQQMNTGYTPAIVFSEGSWTPGTGVWSSGDTVFTVICTLADNNEEFFNWAVGTDVVTVDVTGARDYAGNPQEDYTPLPEFDIDTIKPWVTGVAVDTNPVYEGDLTQQVEVTFNQQMSTGYTPAIVFSEGSWTPGTGVWSSGDTVFTVTCTLADNNEEFFDTTPGVDAVVTVDVIRARDYAGNRQEDYTPGARFEVDTVKPQILNITSDTDNGCYTVVTGAKIDVTMTFTEDVTLSGSIDVTLNVGGPRSVHAVLALTGARAASGTYTVQAGENSCDLNVIAVNVNPANGLSDWAGNYELNSLTLPPGSYMRNGVSIPVGQNMAYHKEIVIDTTIPVTVQDPDGDEDREGSDDTETVDVRSDPYSQYRLTVRENTPAYVDVKFNDSDLPCAVRLRIHDTPKLPENGTVWFDVDDRSGNIRYTPDTEYVGPDEFTYRIYDACGNISQEAMVYVEVVPQFVMEDQYLSTCQNEAVTFDISAADLFIPEHDFAFSILAGPYHGVLVGDLADATYTPHGPTTADLESETITLTYTPASGFTGRDEVRVRVTDPFGGDDVAVADIVVNECTGSLSGGSAIAVEHEIVLPIILPESYVDTTLTAASILMAQADGRLYPDALTARWSEEIHRQVLMLDTGLLPLGTYWLMIPLGDGEQVELMIEVGGAE